MRASPTLRSTLCESAMILSQNPHIDLQILGAAVARLPALLDRPDLTLPIYVNIGGAAYRPAISIGFVLDLLRELRLREAELSPDEMATLGRSEDDLRAARTLHADAYGRHLAREIKSLVDTWGAYLDDLAAGEAGGPAGHATEARKRSRIIHLTAEAAARHVDVAAAVARLADLDRRMDDQLVPGPYCGPAGLSAAFPRDQYPWLYRVPRPRD